MLLGSEPFFSSRIREPGRDLRSERALRARGADLGVWTGRDIIKKNEYILLKRSGEYIFLDMGYVEGVGGQPKVCA